MRVWKYAATSVLISLHDPYPEFHVTNSSCNHFHLAEFIDCFIFYIDYYSLNEGKRRLELDRVAEENKVKVNVNEDFGHVHVHIIILCCGYCRPCFTDYRQLNPCTKSPNGCKIGKEMLN